MFHVEHLPMKSNRSELKSRLKVKDHFLSGEEFDLLFDADLNMMYTHPVPTDHAQYYDSQEYISHTDSKKGFIATLYQWVKSWALRSKINLIESHVVGERVLLDIGAGTGDFLRQAQKRNWKVSGIETSDQARDLAAAKNLVLMAERPGGLIPRPSVVTLWHVLEHLPDPKEYLKWIQTQLRDEGILIIAVPNFESWDAKHYGANWAAWDVPRHLWHFSKTSIEKLTQDDFVLEVVSPMVFDSFYVSLLSEKYKQGNTNVVRAFFNGIRSNMSAWRTGAYSSLIYVLRKR